MFVPMKVSRSIIYALLSACAIAPLAAAAQKTEVIRTVVIDPGHGGKDSGALSQGGKYKEKDVVLQVALKLGKLISDNYPAVKVIYTRKTDVFVELAERGGIANRNSADLFISIHANSNKGAPASGTETFIMGTSKSAANLEVAMRENDVINMESDHTTRYQGYEPGSPESFIIFSLMQYAYREQSLAFASSVQSQYSNGGLKLIDRGVKEAGLIVLWQTSTPAVLTELGFINNNADLQKMISAEGQERYARCLFNAFSAYKTKCEGKGAAIALANDPDGEEGQRTAANTTQAGEPALEAVSQESPATTAEEVPATRVAAQPAAQTPSPTLAPAASQKVTFAVQIRISPKSLSPRDPCFGAYCGKVFEKKIGGIYKYYVEESDSYATATARQAQVRRTVKDAFVVAFLDGTPITVGEALKLIKR